MEQRELLIGRFQPFHNGHVEIIKKMANPVVAVVRGEKTSSDKKRNPIGLEYQSRLINKVFPGIEIHEMPTGYIPSILDKLKEKNIHITTVYCGPDRLKSYKDQIDRYNKTSDSPIAVQFKEARRVYSGTDVRNSVRDNDEKTFRNLMPHTLWADYDTLRILFRLDENISKLFEEDGGGESASNTTSGIESADYPIGYFSRYAVFGGNKKKRRYLMPQIADHSAFVEDLNRSKITYSSVKKNPISLIPTQGHFNEDKIKRMMGETNLKPAIISKDGYIIDGHHRWIVNCEKDKDAECFEVGLTAEEILDFLKDKPYIVNKKINERYNEQIT